MMSRRARDGTAEPVSRDQILRRKRGQGNIHFPCLVYHVQDLQPFPVDPYALAICMLFVWSRDDAVVVVVTAYYVWISGRMRCLEKI